MVIQDNSIQIKNLTSGELIREVRAPDAYQLVRQALIAPDGTIAFLGIAIGEAEYGDPPEDAGVFMLETPYQGEPVMVMSDPGLLNLRGWASPACSWRMGITWLKIHLGILRSLRTSCWWMSKPGWGNGWIMMQICLCLWYLDS